MKKQRILKLLTVLGCLLLAFTATAVSQNLGTVHIKNATLLTVTNGTMEATDMVVKDGIITEIGKNLSTPKGATVVDATGKFVLPGIIDAHSHLAVTRGINEATSPVTAMVSMEDVINPNDVGMYRALAGGVTSIHVMHGSANVIGGQGETIKLRYGLGQDELKFKEAKRTIKFALGENPTRVHGIGRGIQPRTRMAVEQVIRKTFDAAIEYRAKRDAYVAASKAKPKKGQAALVPVAKDLKLEVISDIINGEIYVHCHSYRADEIHMLMRVFNDYGVKNYTFQHANEAFKVAPELAANGARASVFSDWWAYKFEVYYSTAYNATILMKNGVVTSLNSDDEQLIRMLNHEAAKTMRYGQLSEEDALKLITLNPAIQLGTDKYVGSLEVGKQADFAIWNAHPLSVYAQCEMTFVDGHKYFDMANDPVDMRLNINPAEEYGTSMEHEATRHADNCLRDVYYFFGNEAANRSHSHE